MVGIRGSSDNGFYAIATTIASFFPGKPNAIVGAFTAFVAEINNDFNQYHACLAAKLARPAWVSCPPRSQQSPSPPAAGS